MSEKFIVFPSPLPNLSVGNGDLLSQIEEPAMLRNGRTHHNVKFGEASI